MWMNTYVPGGVIENPMGVVIGNAEALDIRSDCTYLFHNRQAYTGMH